MEKCRVLNVPLHHFFVDFETTYGKVFRRIECDGGTRLPQKLIDLARITLSHVRTKITARNNFPETFEPLKELDKAIDWQRSSSTFYVRRWYERGTWKPAYIVTFFFFCGTLNILQSNKNSTKLPSTELCNLVGWVCCANKKFKMAAIKPKVPV